MNIQDLRKENAMTQEDLAAALNVTQGTISLWETKKNRPNVKNLALLAKLFRVDISELIEEFV